jgi:hypothetical protein
MLRRNIMTGSRVRSKSISEGGFIVESCWGLELTPEGRYELGTEAHRSQLWLPMERRVLKVACVLVLL